MSEAVPVKKDFSPRYRRVRLLFRPFVVGLPLVLVGYPLSGHLYGKVVFGVGAALALPLYLYTYVLVILHWKDRYIGKDSDFWGAVLLTDTLGIFKLVYVFYHVIPDMYSRGKYQQGDRAQGAASAPGP